MVLQQLETRLRQEVVALVADATPDSIQVRPANDPRHGDYQCSSIMALAKSRRLVPRQMASDLLARLDLSDICESVEIAGPGFLNFKIRSDVFSQELRALQASPHPWMLPEARRRLFVIDFSSPNVAKPMHVGHIRSTVLGDSLARTLRVLGHKVIADNHIGDWGTQFGMLLLGWKTERNLSAMETDPLAELERIYRLINQRCQESAEVLQRARQELVALQAGDDENLGIWKEMIRLSQKQFDTIYQRLGVTFDHCLGESFYNPWLAETVDDLLKKGIARVSEGAVGVFSDGRAQPGQDPFKIQRDGEWLDNPVLVRKSDGGFNYATTDLATLNHRIREWAPDEIVYVTDGRQQQHFRQVFAAFERWQPQQAEKVRLVHVWFGSILGEDGKPFKTRSGDTIRLAELLDEAEERAWQLVREKRSDLPEARQREIARVVGIGAVKYQDLLPNRQSDYVFSWEKMLALQGNTAPYLQYQFTRANKVVKDAALNVEGAGIDLGSCEQAERNLARQLLLFGWTLETVVQDYRPNLLCNYLYELAGCFSRFWEDCPILSAAEPVRSTRLQLCALTARVLRQGLDCLGVEVSEVM